MFAQTPHWGAALLVLGAVACADLGASGEPIRDNSQAVMTTDLTAYESNGRILVSYSDMSGAASDWVAIAPVGSPSNVYLEWKYTGGGTDGSLAFTKVPVGGVFEARAFYDWISTRSHVVQQRSAPFITTSTAALATDESTYFSGTDVTVSYSNLPADRATWVAFASEGAPIASYVGWKYTDGSATGTLVLSAPSAPGDYVARAFRPLTYILLDESPPFSVTARSAVSSPSPVVRTAPIVVNFAGFQGASTDWISVARPGSPTTTYLRWTYTGGGHSGSVILANNLPAGSYEVRGYFDWVTTHSDAVQASQPLTVIDDPPRIDGMTVVPGLSLRLCQVAALTVTATDPNGDALSYAWEIVTGSGNLTASNEIARFSSSQAGDHVVRVTVTDTHGGAVATTVSLHVAGGSCPWLRGIGSPDSYYQNFATAVSADGTTVTGFAFVSPVATRAFRWTEIEGMVDLGPIARGNAVSSNGSVIAGEGGYRWTAETGWVYLAGGVDFAFGAATAMNADGSVVFGSSISSVDYNHIVPFRWTQATGLLPLSSSALSWAVSAASADGRVVVGFESPTPPSGGQAVRWTESSGPVRFLADRFAQSYAKDVSANGLVIVGQASDGDSLKAFRWTTSGSIQFGYDNSDARAVSADGSIVAGVLGPEMGAMIWDANHGARALSSVLQAADVDLAGFRLTSVSDVSADGRTLVGHGYNARGRGQAWIARLP